MSKEPRMYRITDEEIVRLEKDFSYHPPRPDQVPRYNEIRDLAKAYAGVLMQKLQGASAAGAGGRR